MILSIEEKKLFFKNWLRLLTFVNNKCKLIDDFGSPKSPVGLNPNELIIIRNKLWEDNFLINDYLEHSKIKKEDKDIVKSWNNFVKGKYLFIKSLKKYSVFMDFENKKLYGVNGISSPLFDIMPYLPIMIQTVLIPFN